MTLVEAARPVAGRLLPGLGRLPWAALVAAGTAGVALLLCALALLRPGTPYDLVAYVGAAMWATGAEPHGAWALIRDIVPAAEFAELASGDDYRTRQSTDPAAFASVTPFYAVKIGYVALLASVGDFAHAVRLASWLAVLSAAASVAILVVWLRSIDRTMMAPLAFALAVTLGWYELARHASPDGLAIAFILAAVALWWHGREGWAAGALLVAFLFRPDTLICAAALAGVAFAFGMRWKAMAAAALIMIAASTAIQGWAVHPGWWTHFHFSNVRIQETLVGFETAFDPVLYLTGIARGVVMSLSDFRWPYALVALAMAAIWLLRSQRLPDRSIALCAAMGLTIAGKFALFPLPDDRLYMPFLLAAFVAIAAAWPGLHVSRERSSQAGTGVAGTGEADTGAAGTCP